MSAQQDGNEPGAEADGAREQPASQPPAAVNVRPLARAPSLPLRGGDDEGTPARRGRSRHLAAADDDDDDSDMPTPRPLVVALSAACPCADHPANRIIDEVLPATPQDVFALLFGDGDSKCLVEAHLRTEASDLKIGQWTLGEDGRETRTVAFVGPFKTSMMPKVITDYRVTEVILNKDLGMSYVVERTGQLPKLPYGDVFNILARYCITYDGESRTRLRLTCATVFHRKVIYKESIETSLLSGIHDFARELLHSLKSATVPHPASPIRTPSPSVAAAPAAAISSAGRRRSRVRHRRSGRSLSPSVQDLYSRAAAGLPPDPTAQPVPPPPLQPAFDEQAMENSAATWLLSFVSVYLISQPMHLLASLLNAISPDLVRKLSGAADAAAASLARARASARPGSLAAYLASLEPTVLAVLAAVLLSLLFGFAVTLLNLHWIAALGGRLDRSLAALRSASAQHKMQGHGAPLAVVDSSQTFPAAVDMSDLFRAESAHALSRVRTALRRSSQAMARLHAALDTVAADLDAARPAAAAVSSSTAAAADAARSAPLDAAAEAAARIADALAVGVLQAPDS